MHGIEAFGRCVIWFGRPSDAETALLAQAGWYTQVGDAYLQRGMNTRRGDLVVAMADLRNSDPVVVRAVARLMAEQPHIPWLALISAQTSSRPPELERVLKISVDFFAAPINPQRLLTTLARIAGGRLALAEEKPIPGLLGRSPAMSAAIASVRKYAAVNLPVLISGETGTGKEVAANALHRLSARSAHPFVAINCGALPINLVQSELFGHERGSFTGATGRRIGHIECAAGGTVFLDEVGDLPADAQTSLLRFLQEGTLERVGSSQTIRADVRVLAATNVDLEKAVAQGRFRADLYYRLNVLRLCMPPLRARVGDVELLAQHFLDAYRQHNPCLAQGFDVAATRAMGRFNWPGNVRELINRVQRAAVLAERPLIGVDELELPLDDEGQEIEQVDLDHARIAAERRTLDSCLQESHFNISECARRLCVSRVTVYRLCKKHSLSLTGRR
jgi:two-component system, NtrC family, response regulator HydG